MAALGAVNVFAAGTGLPWETPIQRIANSINGPIAYGLVLAGFSMIGGGLVLNHGDFGEFGRRSAMGTMGAGVVLLAPGMMSVLFGTTGALV